MSVKDTTPRQLSSVPCPTFGVPAGMRCERHSGAPCKEAHVDRKLVSIEGAAKKPMMLFTLINWQLLPYCRPRKQLRAW